MSEFVPATDADVAELAKKLSATPEQVIETVAPNDNEVSLPGGFITREGVLVKYAEVRELNGEDEEAIAKSSNPARASSMIIQRGLVSLGGNKVTSEDLDNLLAGDRDAILLGIRIATFGNTIQQFSVCGKCSSTFVVEVDLRKDIPVKELEDPIEDRSWTLDVKAGTVSVTLPKGLIQKKISENSEKTNAELNTMLLTACVVGVNGELSMGTPTVLRLSMGDREKILSSIVERNPGPRLGEVTMACETCGESVYIPLSLAGMFRF